MYATHAVSEMLYNNNNYPVVNTNEEQDRALQRLFSGERTLPFRERGLPQSFFTQPADGRSTAEPGAQSQNLGHQYFPNVEHQMSHHGVVTPETSFNPHVASMQQHHSRAHSSPATFTAVGVPTAEHLSRGTLHFAEPMQTVHAKQHSFDALEEREHPLPSGWDVAYTPEGRPYYLNHATKTTQWEDPRKSMFAPTVGQGPPPPAHQQVFGGISEGAPPPAHPQATVPQSGQPSQPLTVQQIMANLPPLPRNWEYGIGQDNEIYYIDHNTKQTSWFHPSIPPHLQKAGMKISELRQIMIDQHNQNQSMPQQTFQEERNIVKMPGQHGAFGSQALEGPPAMGVQQQHPTGSLSVTPNIPPQQTAVATQRSAAMKQLMLQQQQQQQMQTTMEAKCPSLMTQQLRDLQLTPEHVTSRFAFLNKQRTDPASARPASGPLRTSALPQGHLQGQVVVPNQQQQLQPVVAMQQTPVVMAQQQQTPVVMAQQQQQTPVVMQQQQTPVAMQQQQTPVVMVQQQQTNPQQQMSATELHNRQESGDSGLGGMSSSCYSHPRTPEDFLAMEASDSGPESMETSTCLPPAPVPQNNPALPIQHTGMVDISSDLDSTLREGMIRDVHLMNAAGQPTIVASGTTQDANMNTMSYI